MLPFAICVITQLKFYLCRSSKTNQNHEVLAARFLGEKCNNKKMKGNIDLYLSLLNINIPRHAKLKLH